MKKPIKAIATFVAIGGVLVFFQNCAEPLPDSVTSSSNSSSSTSPNTPPSQTPEDNGLGQAPEDSGTVGAGGGGNVGAGTSSPTTTPPTGGSYASCPNTPWGTLAHGVSKTAYVTQYPTGTCVSETRTCSNGTFTGSYTATSCTAEIVKVQPGGMNVTLQNLFTAEQWNSPVAKRVMIPADGIVGSSSEVPAVRTGGAWAGVLTLQNGGQIQGGGGGIGGGAGGTALKVDAPGFRLENTGSILGGGGGGGNGGKGGNCTYPVTKREPETGTKYSTSTSAGYYITENYDGRDGGSTSVSVKWNGAWKCQGSTNRLKCDGYTYVKGEKKSESSYTGDSGATHRTTTYAVYRTSEETKSANGDTGTPGGTGQGYITGANPGPPALPGSHGCGNAGSGGQGGTWGLPGAAGGNGTAGNAGAGTNGTPGGAPGYAIDGVQNGAGSPGGTVRGPLR